jgi:hypothetical protein
MDCSHVPVWPKYPNVLLSHRLRLSHDGRFTLNFMAPSPILICNGSLLGRSERGMDWKKLLGTITASVDEEIRLRNTYVVAENRILRQQINGRVPLTDGDRHTLAELGQKLGRQALAEIATVAKADTILAWPRKFVNQTVDTSTPYKSVGRPRVDQEIESLVVRMARENRAWGYDRIVGALANLGYTISDQTVGNILKLHGIPPAPQRKKTVPWREFIWIHMDVLGATDFFNSVIWARFAFVPLSEACREHEVVSPSVVDARRAAVVAQYAYAEGELERRGQRGDAGTAGPMWQAYPPTDFLGVCLLSLPRSSISRHGSGGVPAGRPSPCDT